MRTVLIAVLLLAACSGSAQSETRYDLYIFHPRDGGAQTYAFAADNAAVAIEVRGCGDIHLLPNANVVAGDLRARRHADGVSVVTVEARGSRVDLGNCGADEVPEDPEDVEEDGVNEQDSLVVIENASARQMRRMVETLNAPAEVRSEIISTLGLS
ncbi:MAG: hypothetical protein JNL81_10990 [Hyphomonadaceae bacterium]|nr:hypothetical protein [Hyphomonadaceae bacterium]